MDKKQAIDYTTSLFATFIDNQAQLEGYMNNHSEQKFTTEDDIEQFLYSLDQPPEGYGKLIAADGPSLLLFDKLKKFKKNSVPSNIFKKELNEIRDGLIKRLKGEIVDINFDMMPASSVGGKMGQVNPVHYIDAMKGEQIDAKNLRLVVNFIPDTIDIDYQDGKFKLKNELMRHIEHSLKEEEFEVFCQCKALNILDDEVFLSSELMGSYFYDPFLEGLEVRIQRQGGEYFRKKFKVIGMPELKFEKVNKLLKKDDSFTYKPNDNIIKLLKNMCESRNQTEQLDKLNEAFRGSGGVRKVKDLFSFTKDEIKTLGGGIRTKWAHEIFQTVQKVKSFSEKIAKQKEDMQEDRRMCIKIGNSHKLLRYLVYKASPRELQMIPFINYSNMKNAIKIVRKQIINDELWDLLERQYFFQFASQKIKKTSNGMILYGPPGTGKTQITELLPHLIGFQLIDQGKSAADFKTTYQGQTRKMLEDLVSRARATPYIQCSVGIDEVDGLIPDRKDKKGGGGQSTEGISMLLSLIGGNKAVKNLVFLTSTNHLKKIDEAMLRRFSGQYQVGRLDPKDREKILVKEVPELRNEKQILNSLRVITSNYTGAALGALINSMKLQQQIMAHERKDQKNRMLSVKQIINLASEVCCQFKIKLGMYSLPQIYADQAAKKQSCNLDFFKKIAFNFALFSEVVENKKEFKISYASFYRKQVEDRVYPFFERNEEVIKVRELAPNMPAETLKYWINQKNPHVRVEILEKKSDTSSTFVSRINDAIKDRDSPTILIVVLRDNHLSIFQKTRLIDRKKNLFKFLLAQGKERAEEIREMMNWLKWTNEENLNKKLFTGRIFVELKENPKMNFQLNPTKDDATLLYEKTFIRNENAKAVNDVVPELIEFFTKRDVSSIFLLDYNALMDNEAFEEQKQLQIIRQKVEQAINYNKVAIIIEADSLINISKNLSESSMGPSNSFSITNSNIYLFLINIMKTFPMITKDEETNKERWISIVCKNTFLSNILKEVMSWPKTHEEMKEADEDRKQNEEKKCFRCGAFYKEKDNLEKKECMQHPGPILNLRKKELEKLDVNGAKVLEKADKQLNPDRKDELYAFACCMGSINEEGETAYCHITKEEFMTQKDEHFAEKESRKADWLKNLQIFISYKK